MRQLPITTAIVIPESGHDDEPTRPVMRADTTENRKPKTTISAAPSTFIRKTGTTVMKATIASEPPTTHVSGVSLSVRVTVAPPADPPRSCFTEAVSDSQIAGAARTSPRIPPIATAPAPMYRRYLSLSAA